MLNKVTLIGNLGRDPDIKTLPSSAKAANISMATSESWKDKEGNKKESTEWHRVVVYGDGLVRVIENYVKKGTKVYIEGSIRSRKYTDSASGVEKTSTEIIVDSYSGVFKILDNKSTSAPSRSGGESDYKSGALNNNSSEDIEYRSPFSNEVDDEVPF